MRPTTSIRRPSLTRRTLAVAAIAIAASSCATGERPTLEPVPEVDDAAAAVVVQRLRRAESVQFTATYDIIPTTTGAVTTAKVEQSNGRQRIKIGDVEYRSDGSVSETCTNGGQLCVDFIEDARVSDLNITSRFWSDAFSKRLTVDAARRVGFSEGSTTTIAEQQAVCADVPVLGGTVLYCALDAGILARYVGADVSIELTSFSTQAAFDQ